MRGEDGVAGEGRLVGEYKCTVTLMNMQSDWMSVASSGEVGKVHLAIHDRSKLMSGSLRSVMIKSFSKTAALSSEHPGTIWTLYTLK